MKKLLLGALVLAAAISAAFVFLKKATVHSARAAELVPGDTIFFAQFPDWKRSNQRWPQTALAQIWAEPEMQAFLAKPREKAPGMKLWQERMDQITQIAPGEAFLAVTSIDGPQPKIVAGFSFTGKKADVAALLAEPHEEMKKAWPAGKSDLSNYHGSDIESFSHQDVTVAEAFHGEWYFVSNDMELLHSTIDAASQAASPKSLAALDVFKKSTAHLPPAEDSILFTQLGTITERLVSLAKASGQTLDPKQIESLKNIQAVAWGTKIEGTQLRDTIFILSPGGKSEGAMARNATALTAPDTVLYYATGVPVIGELPPSASTAALSTVLPGLQGMETALAAKGLKWSDLGNAFGPEFGTVLDWPMESAQPAALFALDVRDAAKAKGFVDAFTGGTSGSATWGRKEDGGVTIYQGASAGGFLAFTPTLALTDRFLVLGLSADSVKQGLARLKAGKATITQSSAYQEGSKAVKAPNSSFGYLDLKTFFERSYGTLRPFIAMSLAFNPESGKYLDASKLPATETISKHLGPSVYSQTVSDDGTLIESVGTLTFHQVLLGGFGGSIIAAYPMIENAMAGGLKIDPNLLQLKPGAPTATPAPQSQPAPGTTPQNPPSGSPNP